MLNLEDEAEIMLAGRWAKLFGERCAVYIFEAASGGFYTWCDIADARSVEFYRDPQAAVIAGLGRASVQGSVEPDGT